MSNRYNLWRKCVAFGLANKRWCTYFESATVLLACWHSRGQISCRRHHVPMLMTRLQQTDNNFIFHITYTLHTTAVISNNRHINSSAIWLALFQFALWASSSEVIVSPLQLLLIETCQLYGSWSDVSSLNCVGLQDKVLDQSKTDWAVLWAKQIMTPLSSVWHK